MNRCLGPCCDRVDEASYAELVKGTALFLRGRSDELRQDLERRMQEAADAERFEEAVERGFWHPKSNSAGALLARLISGVAT